MNLTFADLGCKSRGQAHKCPPCPKVDLYKNREGAGSAVARCLRGALRQRHKGLFPRAAPVL